MSDFKTRFTEHIGVRHNGHLWVEECDCTELAERFGTPLYVVSESQLRTNYRRFRDAFATRHPNVQVLFANKALNNLAVRHVMNDEGAGGDCFGVAELYLSLLSGADPGKLVLNGSNKSRQEIEMAVEAGVCINIDAMDELDLIETTSRRLGKPVDVGVRVSLELAALEERYSGSTLHGQGSLADQGRDNKWGMTLDQTIELARRIAALDSFTFKEIHYHLGRVSHCIDDFAAMGREMVQWAAAIRDATGTAPDYLDLGGGWTVGRPEGFGPAGEDDASTPSFEEYAQATVDAISEECEHLDLPLPGLKLEPGRAIAASAVITLGRVGAVKVHPDFKTWVNVDCSTNHVIRIFTSDWYHHIHSVNKADQRPDTKVDVVGSLCSLDVLGSDRYLPSPQRGDLVALLDTGAYAETAASNFNAEPKPATVLVRGQEAEIITERETLRDVVGRFRVPARFFARSGRTAHSPAVRASLTEADDVSE